MTFDIGVGGLAVDLSTRRIMAEGAERKLTPKAAAVLSALIEANGDVRTRADLLDRVWPDVHVTEEVLTQAIAELRRAFGDDARNPKFLETIAKQGYRLLPRVEKTLPARPAATVDHGPQPVQGSASDASLAVETLPLVESPAAQGPSVVVVPFDCLAGGGEAQTVAAGLTRDIAGSLSRSRWLFVSGRGSAAALSSQTEDPIGIAQRLGVRYALWGSVIVSAGQIRVSAHLCDAVTKGIVWADRYERPMAGVFEVLDDIGETVARTVESEIETHLRRVARIAPIATLDAWGLFHRASKGEYASTGPAIEEARALLEKAHSLDPTSARITAALSALTLRRHMFVAGRGQVGALEEGMDLALSAVELDAAEPDGLVALGRALGMSGDRPGSLARLEAAVTMNPGSYNARRFFAWSLLLGGRHRDALDQTTFAERVSPFEPNGFTLHAVRAHALALEEDYMAAWTYAARAVLHPRANDQTTALAAWCAAAAGHTEHARTYAARLRRVRPDFRTDDYFSWFRFTGEDRERIARHLGSAGL